MVTEYQYKSLKMDFRKQSKIIDEQQTEIERLQEYNDTLETLNQAAKDENQRLRAALERIATKPPVNEEYGNQGYDADQMIRIAREALQEGES